MSLPRRSWLGVVVMAAHNAEEACAFIPHVTGSVLLGGYTPGVFSAVAMVVPYCLWYFKRALSEQWVGGAGFVAAFAVGAVLYAPAVWTLLGLRGR
jgi:Protein of unknown function with HXXEE motif